ncbi:hypothetical protein LLG95_10565 [bacterium]|nr:hypothetical protein [bacterium]
MGENHFARATVALYGVPLLMAAIAYSILQHAILARHGNESLLAIALGHDVKGKASIVLYLLAIPSAFITSWIAGIIYIAGALMWLIPDRRIERTMQRTENQLNRY